MQVLIGQLDLVWEDAAANVALVTEGLLTHPPVPGSCVVLPEMFASGFSMDAARACRDGERVLAAMAGWARQYDCWLVGGLALMESGGATNAAVGFRPDGSEWFRFRKLHGFRPAGESEVYRPGTEVGVWKVRGFQMAPFICYDLRFPEVFREASARGADLMLVLANWPARRERHWLTLLQARAIENQAWVVGVNRAGVDPHATYSGRSVVVDPKGVVRADAGEGSNWLRCELNVEESRRWRAEFPALLDRRW